MPEIPGFARRSHAMRKLLATMAAMSTTDCTALVVGEAGTGKRRLALQLHRHWAREGKRRTIDCSLPHEHLASLFSYRTPLEKEKRGTLVLVHVDQLLPDLQRDLYGVEYRLGFGRRGGWALVGTTTKDLAALVSANRFDLQLAELLRKNLLTMPPLRERRADLVVLVRELLSSLGDEEGEPPKAIASEALDAIDAYHWPGNVIELEAALRHAVLATGDRSRVELGDLPRKVRGAPELDAVSSEWPTLETAEQRLILATLQRYGGHHGSAAAALGIHANTLSRKLKKYGLSRRRRRT